MVHHEVPPDSGRGIIQQVSFRVLPKTPSASGIPDGCVVLFRYQEGGDGDMDREVGLSNVICGLLLDHGLTGNYPDNEL